MLRACQVLSWKFFNFFSRRQNVDCYISILLDVSNWHTHAPHKKKQCVKRYTLHTSAYNWIYLSCIYNLPMHTDLKTLNFQHFCKHIQQFIQSTSPPGYVFSYSINWYTHPQTHFLDSKQHGTIFPSETKKTISNWSTRN